MAQLRALIRKEQKKPCDIGGAIWNQGLCIFQLNEELEIGDLMGFSNLNVDSEKDYGTSVQAPKEMHVKLGGGVENF